MSDFTQCIDDLNNQNLKNKSLTDIKKDILFKNISKYVKGGVSKLTKDNTINGFCTKIINDPLYKTNQNYSGYTSLSELGILGKKIMETHGKEIASQYKYIFFDEFQDIDKNHFLILHEFYKNNCKLNVIG